MAPGDRVLAAQKPTLWGKFMRMVRLRPPDDVDTPDSPQEALELGYRLGLQTGYGEGLVDGVDLGVDVGADIIIGVSDPMDSLN